MARRDISDYKSIEELRDLWRERAERGREFDLRTDPTGMTRPPRDPDERAYLEKHGGLGPFIEKPNPPWATGWPPRNPNRPLTEREQLVDATGLTRAPAVRPVRPPAAAA